MQRTTPVIYLLEDYRGKSIAGAFYEHELRRATHPESVSRGKNIAQEGRQGVRQVMVIRWIVQFMDTQKQCHLINKIFIHIIYFVQI